MCYALLYTPNQCALSFCLVVLERFFPQSFSIEAEAAFLEASNVVLEYGHVNFLHIQNLLSRRPYLVLPLTTTINEDTKMQNISAKTNETGQ